VILQWFAPIFVGGDADGGYSLRVVKDRDRARRIQSMRWWARRSSNRSGRDHTSRCGSHA